MKLLRGSAVLCNLLAVAVLIFFPLACRTHQESPKASVSDAKKIVKSEQEGEQERNKALKIKTRVGREYKYRFNELDSTSARLNEVIQYDHEGRMLERLQYETKVVRGQKYVTQPSYKELFLHDSTGRLNEKDGYAPNGLSPKKKWNSISKVFYKYSEKGWLLEETNYGVTGLLPPSHTVFEYDEQGNLKAEVSGSYKAVYTYDSLGRKAEQLSFDPSYVQYLIERGFRSPSTPLSSAYASESYEYDVNGLLARVDVIEDTLMKKVILYRYEYYK